MESVINSQGEVAGTLTNPKPARTVKLRPLKEITMILAKVEAGKAKGVSIRDTLAKLGVSTHTYSGWLAKSKEEPKKAQRHKTSPSELSRLEKLKIVKRVKSGEKLVNLSREIGVSNSAIAGWVKGKWLGSRESLNLHPTVTGSVKKPKQKHGGARRALPAVRAKAIAMLKEGKAPKEVARQIGFDVSSIYSWRAKAAGEPSAKAVVVESSGEVMPVTLENGDGRGGRIKQAAVMLQLALQSAEKRIKSGNASLRDAQTAYTVLALNVLLGE